MQLFVNYFQYAYLEPARVAELHRSVQTDESLSNNELLGIIYKVKVFKIHILKYSVFQILKDSKFQNLKGSAFQCQNIPSKLQLKHRV